MRKLSLIAFFSLTVSFGFLSCAGEDVDTCDHCPESFPWSTPGSSDCYADPSDCELAEGEPCELCF